MPDAGILWCFFNTPMVRWLGLIVVGGGVGAAIRLMSSIPPRKNVSSKLARGPIARFNRARKWIMAIAAGLVVGAAGGVAAYFSLFAALGGATSCPLPAGLVPEPMCVYGLYALGISMVLAVWVGELILRILKET